MRPSRPSISSASWMLEATSSRQPGSSRATPPAASTTSSGGRPDGCMHLLASSHAVSIAAAPSAPTDASSPPPTPLLPPPPPIDRCIAHAAAAALAAGASGQSKRDASTRTPAVPPAVPPAIPPARRSVRCASMPRATHRRATVRHKKPAAAAPRPHAPPLPSTPGIGHTSSAATARRPQSAVAWAAEVHTSGRPSSKLAPPASGRGGAGAGAHAWEV
eukprot:356135-Chlamydomonas_euryale.AAC.4